MLIRKITEMFMVQSARSSKIQKIVACVSHFSFLIKMYKSDHFEKSFI